MPVLTLLCGKREGSGCKGGQGGAQPEPIAGIAFIDWPPFIGCRHACYIKETPPTAAPDNLQH